MAALRRGSAVSVQSASMEARIFRLPVAYRAQKPGLKASLAEEQWLPTSSITLLS